MFIFLTRSYISKYYNNTLSHIICGFIFYLLIILVLFKISSYNFSIIVTILFILLEIYFIWQKDQPLAKPDNKLMEMEIMNDENIVVDPSLDIEIFHDTTEDLSKLFYTDMEKN